MKVEAVPFFGILVGLVLGPTFFLVRYELYRFRDAEQKQYCGPAIKEGTQRLGKDVQWLREDQLVPGLLVRFRTARTGNEATSRILAVAGQRVAIDGGKILIDGEEATDVWGRRGSALEWSPEVLVPEGCVYVLNDQRSGNGSERLDSRTFGPIPARSIQYVFTPKKEDK